MDKKQKELIKAAQIIHDACNGDCGNCSLHKHVCIVNPYNQVNTFPCDWVIPKIDLELTILEEELLKYFYKTGIRYIAKNRDNYYATLYDCHPVRTNSEWKRSKGRFVELHHYSGLFKFIEWEDDPKLVSDLIDLKVI